MMTAGEIDNFVTNNWKMLQSKARDIHKNCKGKGNYEDVLQNAYIELRTKCNNISSDKDAMGYFCRFVHYESAYHKSNYNHAMTHTTRASTWCDPEVDDLDDKIELEKWYNEAKCALNSYKSRGPVQRILLEHSLESQMDSTKIMEKINLPYFNTWKRVKTMKEDIFKEREFTRKERYKIEDFECPGPWLIAGCGPSIESVKDCNLSSVTVIGVNDISRHIPVDFHCILDPIHLFTKERQDVIANTESDVIFTHLPTNKIAHRSSKVCDLKFHKDRGFYGDQSLLSKSTHSTFVAACIAIRLGATSIAFAGMDLVGHPNFQNDRVMQQTKKHILQLCAWCHDNGIIVYNLGSENILSDVKTVNQVDYESWIDDVWK